MEGGGAATEPRAIQGGGLMEAKQGIYFHQQDGPWAHVAHNQVRRPENQTGH